MKKSISLVLAIVLVLAAAFSLTACGGTTEGEEASPVTYVRFRPTMSDFCSK